MHGFQIVQAGDYFKLLIKLLEPLANKLVENLPVRLPELISSLLSNSKIYQIIYLNLASSQAFFLGFPKLLYRDISVRCGFGFYQTFLS